MPIYTHTGSTLLTELLLIHPSSLVCFSPCSLRTFPLRPLKVILQPAKALSRPITEHIVLPICLPLPAHLRTSTPRPSIHQTPTDRAPTPWPHTPLQPPDNLSPPSLTANLPPSQSISSLLSQYPTLALLLIPRLAPFFSNPLRPLPYSFPYCRRTALPFHHPQLLSTAQPNSTPTTTSFPTPPTTITANFLSLSSNPSSSSRLLLTHPRHVAAAGWSGGAVTVARGRGNRAGVIP
ncbi:unnamed protein product, partial [Closterium sp. NIES-54]